MALLSGGWDDSAWFEHTFLAAEMGVALVQSSDLSVREGKLLRHMGSDVLPVDVRVRAHGRGHDAVVHRLRRCAASGGSAGSGRSGTLTIANALGNGIADDKAIYAYVPGDDRVLPRREAALAQVPTWICAEREQRDYVIDHLAELVVKPIDGFGGIGVVIGPEATIEALDARRRELQAQPERYIAQEMIALSTHPTFDGEGMYPHHVDLRAFVHLRAGPGESVSAHVMPAALTRVAAQGSRIVNSSSGGGSKDTWIRTKCQNDPALDVGTDRQYVWHLRRDPFDGESADVAAVTRMTGAMASRGPDSDGIVAHGPIAFGHRRLSIIDLSARGAQPMVDSDLGLTLVFNGCIYNYQDLRPELEAAGYRFFSDRRQRGGDQGVPPVGHPLCRSVQRHVRLRDRRPRNRCRHAWPGTDSVSNRCIWRRPRAGCGSHRPCARCSMPATWTPNWIAHALHHYMSFHSVVPAPRTIYRGVRKLPPATVRVIQPDGSHHRHRLLDTGFARDPARASWSARDWQDALMDALRTAVGRRMVADVPVGVLLSGGIDSSIVVALLAEQGQHGLATFSIGFDSVGGESGDEYFYSDLVAKTFDTDHHRIHIDSSRLLPAVPKTIAAMSEPMVSHDCVAFYLLSEEVSKSVKVVQSGQGADEILAGYDWYPPLADVAREQTTDAYAKVFFDRGHADVLGHLCARIRVVDGDPSREFVTAHQAAPGADTAVDAALRLDTTGDAGR